VTELTNELRAFLGERRYAVLATHGKNRIDLTPIWFLFENDRFYFATNSGSKKVANLRRNAAASVVVDSREPGRERWLAADGPVEILEGDCAQRINRRIRERYLTPSGLAEERIEGGLAASDDVTLILTPDSWRTWSAPIDLDAPSFPGQTFEQWFLPVVR
jgi:PPOX class probable F420-dependent enzyme